MKTDKKNPKKLKSKNAPPVYKPGVSPEKDAWFTAFFIENHLDYITHPERAATPEQVRFMVYTEEDERYYPCSKPMFEAIMSRNKSPLIQKQYKEALQRLMELIDSQIEDKKDRKYLETLIKIKYAHEIRDQIMIPSRLEKRLLRIFLNRTQIEDPFHHEKKLRNYRMHKVLNSSNFKKALNHVDGSELTKSPQSLLSIRGLADHLVIQRLFSLAIENLLWESEKGQKYTKNNYLKIFHKPLKGNGVNPLFQFLGIQDVSGIQTDVGKKRILWLADEAGEVMVDFAIIKYLTKLGHKIIIVFKEGPLFTKVNIGDVRADAILKKELEGALLIDNKVLSKNELVKMLKSQYSIIALPDGTRENLNLLLASTTFARIFKEVDGVISRGHDQKRRLFDTDFQFTQDVFNISGNNRGVVNIIYKSKHPSVIKFSHEELEKKANALIEQMTQAKKNGMTVVFYSGIIGSIPGKIKTAKKIMAVFIDYLKQQSAKTYIINPSEFFEQGMDADDLMYMWEIVQRSGMIDIWRFQTYDDIARAFSIIKTKVPPEWFGKDATFSTGCTKEMKIALEVQRDHPEMQIIGPAKEKFMRRMDYGIGKMYDQRFTEIIQQP